VIFEIIKFYFFFMKQRFFLTVLCLFLFGSLFAQTGLEANVNTSGVLGLEYLFGNKVSAGIRVEGAKVDASSLTPFVKLNLKHFTDATFFMGVGLKGLEPLQDVSIPIGIRATPFGESSSFGFILELENIIGDEYYLRPTVGFSYRIGK
jgi:hypothetical protein